jgi:hypothetical protein
VPSEATKLLLDIESLGDVARRMAEFAFDQEAAERLRRFARETTELAADRSPTDSQIDELR